MTELARRKISLYALFLLPGLSISSWVTRTPAIRDRLDASTAEMGLVLFGLSVGSMVGILSSGALIAHCGTKAIITIGTAGIAVSMPTIGVGALSSSPVAVAIGLGVFGLGMGGGEVAMNVEGSAVEKLSSRPVLPQMHGFFSAGTVVGALAGWGFTVLDFSVVAHLAIIGALTFGVLIVSIRAVPSSSVQNGGGAVAEPARAKEVKPLWSDRRLWCLGGVVLALALAEGTANDWLPLVMVDGHGLNQALGTAVYAGFAAAMATGRFVGGAVVQKLGRAWVLAASAVLAAVGMVLVSIVNQPEIVVLSVVMWGIGTSLGFPVALSAAGESGPDTASRVSLASIVGYLAFLVGPPSLGLLGDEIGLRLALLAPAALVLLSVPLATAAGRRSEAVGKNDTHQPSLST